MRESQEAARPLLIELLQGKWPVIQETEARQLAVWATITTMVYEFMDEATVAVTKEERYSFFENKAPLPNWQFAIGRYLDADPRKQVANNHYTIGTDPASAVEKGLATKPNIQTSALLFGRSIFFVASSAPGAPTLNIENLLRVHDLAAFWPMRDTVVRRPMKAHNSTGFNLIGNWLPISLGLPYGENWMPWA